MAAHVLSRWLTSLSNNSVVQCLQDHWQKDFDELFVEENEPVLESEQHTGPVQVRDSQTGALIKGYAFKGRLVGNALEVVSDGKHASLTLLFFKRGVKHGFFRTLIGSSDQLWRFGYFLNNQTHGKTWTRTEGGGILIKNQHDDCGIFLYPDLKTALVGHFREEEENDKDFCMTSAFPAKVCGIREGQFGMPELVLTNPDETNVYRREADNDESICEYPEVEDPLERNIVEVRTSLIPNAGEGLFSRANLSKGSILAFFNGTKKSKMANITSEYAIGLDDNDDKQITIDIPERCRSTQHYKATLAHKICHSFDENARFAHCFHPRFGRIRCALAIRDIKEGEEITCNYKYAWSKAPQWYKDSLKKHLSYKEKLSDHIINDILNKFDNGHNR